MKRGSKRWLKGLIILLLLLLAIPWLQGMRKVYRLSKEKERLIAENMAIERENERLKAEIERLKKDLEYIKRVARKELGMIGEREVIYRFTEE